MGQRSLSYTYVFCITCTQTGINLDGYNYIEAEVDTDEDCDHPTVGVMAEVLDKVRDRLAYECDHSGKAR